MGIPCHADDNAYDCLFDNVITGSSNIIIMGVLLLLFKIAMFEEHKHKSQ